MSTRYTTFSSAEARWPPARSVSHTVPVRPRMLCISMSSGCRGRTRTVYVGAFRRHVMYIISLQWLMVRGRPLPTVLARRVLTHGLMEARLRSLSGGGDARKAPSRPSGVRRAETRCMECSSGIRCHAKRHASGRRSEVVSKGFSHPQGAARGNGRTADGVGPA